MSPSVSHILSSEDGERSIIMAPGSTSYITSSAVDAHFARAISQASIVTTEISQVPLSGVNRLLSLAASSGALTMLDVDVSPSVAIGEAALGLMDEIKAAVSSAVVLKPSLEAATELLAAFGAPLHGGLSQPSHVPTVAGEDMAVVAERLRVTFGNQVVSVSDERVAWCRVLGGLWELCLSSIQDSSGLHTSLFVS
jgi:sugar/nucleoside kinase (ribokinase family)